MDLQILSEALVPEISVSLLYGVVAEVLVAGSRKSDNARIQSLYHRKKDLKGQFKKVTAIQKDALRELSLKPLRSIEDLAHLKSLLEYNEVTDTLIERRNTNAARYEARRRIEGQTSSCKMQSSIETESFE